MEVSARRLWLALAVALALAAATRAEAQIGTLALDSSAYVSYSDTANAPIPAGSTVRFHFGTANGDGSIPITIEPADLSIAPITVAEGSTIQYSLDGTATGTLRSVGGAKQIELLATLVASLGESSETAPVTYQLRFTTGTAQATNASQTDSVTVDGTPAAASSYVRLVGAATNAPDAFPGPGEAVYAVLSGSFDWLPGGP